MLLENGLDLVEYKLALGLIGIAVVEQRVAKVVGDLLKVFGIEVSICFLVESGAVECGLHGERVHYAHVPHNDAARALFALLYFESARLVRKLGFERTRHGLGIKQLPRFRSKQLFLAYLAFGIFAHDHGKYVFVEASFRRVVVVASVDENVVFTAAVSNEQSE